MKKTLFMFVVLLSSSQVILGMEQTEPALIPLSIQDLIDRNEVPAVAEMEFEDLGWVIGYIFSNQNLTSLEGLENLPEIEDVQALAFEGNIISEISAQDFKAVPNLISLEIIDNPLRKISSRSLNNLPHLKILKLHNLLLEELPAHFLDYQKELEELVITQCSLNDIPLNEFVYLESLKVLDLQYNQLTKFPARLIAHMQNLIGLNLSHNKLSTVSDKLILKELSIINLRENPITHLSPEVIKIIQKQGVWTGLPREVLPIYALSIGDLIAQRNAPQVNAEHKYLNLNALQLTSLDGLELIKNIETVKVLEATHNYLEKIPTDLWEICPNLKSVNLGNNYVTVLESKTYTGDANEGIPLRTLTLQANSMERIDPGALRQFGSLKGLNLRNNKIIALSGQALVGPMFLQALDLSQNRLSEIDEYAFRQCPYLLSISLSENQLTRIPSFRFKDGKAKLEVDLSHNYLTNLPNRIINKQHGLTLIIGKQHVPKLKWLVAIRIAQAFARADVSRIVQIIRTKKLDSGTLNLIFQASDNTTKEKISEALNTLAECGEQN